MLPRISDYLLLLVCSIVELVSEVSLVRAWAITYWRSFYSFWKIDKNPSNCEAADRLFDVVAVLRWRDSLDESAMMLEKGKKKNRDKVWVSYTSERAIIQIQYSDRRVIKEDWSWQVSLGRKQNYAQEMKSWQRNKKVTLLLLNLSPRFRRAKYYQWLYEASFVFYIFSLALTLSLSYCWVKIWNRRTMRDSCVDICVVNMNKPTSQ